MTALTHPGRLPPGFSFASSSCLGIKSHLTYVCWMYMLWTHFGYTSATRHLHGRCGCALVQAHVCPCPCPCLCRSAHAACIYSACTLLPVSGGQLPIAGRTEWEGTCLRCLSALALFGSNVDPALSSPLFTPALSHSERALFRHFYPDYTVRV